MTETATPARPAGAMDVLRSLGRGRVLITLLLGLGSGLPFMLTATTLGYWLREYGMTLSAIGFLSWVGMAYTMKVFWAPVLDRVSLPVLGRLGRRRGWMLLSQIVVGGALIGMGIVGPSADLTLFVWLTVITAFASATQDTAVDAWRIESAENDDDLGLLTSAFTLGARTAMTLSGSLILFLAAGVGWGGAYIAFGAAMAVAIGATLFAKEPIATVVAAERERPLWTPRGFFDAVVGPFVAFLKEHGSLAILMLAAISLYRLGDFMIGPMINPFYVDLGLTKTTVGAVRLVFGTSGGFVGIALAGLCAIRFGLVRTLVVGAILGPMSNLGFTALAIWGADPTLFATVMFIDDFSGGFAGTALVAYMSSLTSLGYTATQYALLSSFYAFLGKALKGFSGQIVEGVAAGSTLMHGYAVFYAGTAAIALPVVILCIVVARLTRRRNEELVASGSA
ncbi:MAG TPA: MFS transporter [Caulobacteraceae bacterium]|jgi:PAT family beta-lactamase induction signal transducer AmpG